MAVGARGRRWAAAAAAPTAGRGGTLTDTRAARAVPLVKFRGGGRAFFSAAGQLRWPSDHERAVDSSFSMAAIPSWFKVFFLGGRSGIVLLGWVSGGHVVRLAARGGMRRRATWGVACGSGKATRAARPRHTRRGRVRPNEPTAAGADAESVADAAWPRRDVPRPRVSCVVVGASARERVGIGTSAARCGELHTRWTHGPRWKGRRLRRPLA